MLREITTATQTEGEPRRRWFSDDGMDLYVWYDGEDIVQFQICSGKGTDERALTWSRASGFSFNTVDDGESGVFRMKSSPVLKARTKMDLGPVRRRFAESAQKLEHDLYTFIVTRLEESKK